MAIRTPSAAGQRYLQVSVGDAEDVACALDALDAVIEPPPGGSVGGGCSLTVLEKGDRTKGP
jgi:hypothetical protein